MKTFGSRAEVFHGTAEKTPGGLKKKDLFQDKYGAIKSKAASKAALTRMEEEGKKWIEFNDKWSRQWPVITDKKDSMDPDNKHRDEPDRLNKYFKNK